MISYDPELISSVQAGLIDHLPFAALLGISVSDLSPSRAVVSLPWREDLLNHLGGHHAGAIFTTGETAAAALLAMVSLSSGRRAVVMDAAIRFMRSSKGVLYATATFGENQSMQTGADARGFAEHLPISVHFYDEAGRPVGELSMTGRLSPT